jgi:hypothetical protein
MIEIVYKSNSIQPTSVYLYVPAQAGSNIKKNLIFLVRESNILAVLLGLGDSI